MKLKKLLASGLAVSMSMTLSAPTLMAENEEAATDSVAVVEEAVLETSTEVFSNDVVDEQPSQDLPQDSVPEETLDTPVADEVVDTAEEATEDAVTDGEEEITPDTEAEDEPTLEEQPDTEETEIADNTEDKNEAEPDTEEADIPQETVDETTEEAVDEEKSEAEVVEETADEKATEETEKTEEKIAVTVTFDSGASEDSIVVEVGEDGAVALPENPKRVGYQFDGWYIDQELTIEFDGTQVTESITVYAKWLEAYEIVFETNGAPQIESIYRATALDEADMPVPVYLGYQFEGWYTDAEFTALWDGAVSEAMTVYAKWTKMFKLTFEVNGGNELEPVYTLESSVTPPTPVLADALFLGWYTDAECTALWDGTVSEDITLYAKWIKDISKSFTMTADSGYYGEHMAPESGDISFIATFSDWEEFSGRISAFGMYVYVFEDEGVTSESASIEEFENNNGKFCAVVTDIAPDSFESPVYAKPYVTIDNETFFGGAISARVNENKWLGQKIIGIEEK